MKKQNQSRTILILLTFIFMIPTFGHAQGSERAGKKVTVEVAALGGASGSPYRRELQFNDPSTGYSRLTSSETVNMLAGVEVRPRFGKHFGARLGLFYAPSSYTFRIFDLSGNPDHLIRNRYNAFDVSVLGDFRFGNTAKAVTGIINAGLTSVVGGDIAHFRKDVGGPKVKVAPNDPLTIDPLDILQSQLGGGIQYRIKDTKFSLSTEVGGRLPLTRFHKRSASFEKLDQIEYFAQAGLIYRLSR